ncbi:MAG: putative metal-dependent hydrolase [Truepera sp.]|nr:putative metal-dependent hydrolase [Truepera sp.]
MDDLRYPIGRFRFVGPATRKEREAWLMTLTSLPEALRRAVDGLDEIALDTPYREGGWTVRQVVHHVSDSHLNAYTRFKLALTEDRPTIRPYDQDLWAALADSTLPVVVSLDFLDALHRRWAALLEAMDEADFQSLFLHPETGSEISLELNLAHYAWHGMHHTAHITRLRDRMGW